MRSTRTFRVVNIMACEFVRTETNNKYTIIGAIPSGDMNVPAFPATLGIAFYIEALLSEMGHQTIKIAILYNKRRIGVLSVEMEVTNVKAPAIIAFPTVSVLASEPGSLELYVENGHRYRIFKESIRLADQLPSTAVPAP
jgi:hypothetical protein